MIVSRRAGLLVTLGLVVVGCGGTRKPIAPDVTGAELAFRDVRVFDGETLSPPGNVVVGKGKILAVGDVAIPSGVEVVDGRGRVLLPGLIDAHAHVFDPAQLEQSLVFGVTTVLDMFTAVEAMRTLHAGDDPGRADFRSAGILATAPGGHGTEYGFAIPTISGPDEAQAFVDARIADGSDYIKIVYDDYRAYNRKMPTVSRETLTALIEAAHRRDKLAVVHIGDYQSAREAIEAGADGLVHLFRDQVPAADFGTLVASHKAFVVPTLVVSRGLYGGSSKIADDPAIAPYLTVAARGGLTASFGLHASGPKEAVPIAIGQLRAAGAPILAGTDAPNPGTAHGASVHDELELLVAAGLTPTEALTAATSAPARAFRLDDRGRIAPGLRADLVLVDGDPTADVTRTRHIVGVWRGGVRLDRQPVKASQATAPAGAISDFETGDLSTGSGQAWVESTDTLIGGSSSVAHRVIEVGGGKALEITGTVATKGQAQWAGMLFSPGPHTFEPIDLSSTKGLRFRARGDGKTYSVMVFSQSHGRVPIVQPFATGKELAVIELPWTRFDGIDGSDVMAIFIGATAPGAFSLVIDDVTLW